MAKSRKKKKAAKGPDISPVDVNDAELFVKLCKTKGEHRHASLNDLAERMNRPMSTIAQCLRRLEGRYGGTLIIRKPRQGIGELTHLGSRCFQAFDTALRSWQSLTDRPLSGELAGVAFGDPKTVRIGATPALQQQVLPGAISAHIMRLRMERSESDPNPIDQIRLTEGYYPDLIAGVSDGRYDFAVGWQLPAEEFEHIAQDEILANVEFGLIAASDEVRNLGAGASKSDDPLNVLLGKPPDEPIQVKDLARAVRRKTIAVVGYQNIEALNPVWGALLAHQVIIVKTYEDVLALVRMGLADFGWVPEFYRVRPAVSYRALHNEKGPVALSIVTYRRTTAGKLEDIPQAAEKLLETIRDFTGDETFQRLILARTKNESREPRIGPEAVFQWVKDKSWANSSPEGQIRHSGGK